MDNASKLKYVELVKKDWEESVRERIDEEGACFGICANMHPKFDDVEYWDEYEWMRQEIYDERTGEQGYHAVGWEPVKVHTLKSTFAWHPRDYQVRTEFLEYLISRL